MIRAGVILLAGTALAVANATSTLPVEIAIAATVLAILPAVRSVALACRDRRRHEDELARNIDTILYFLAEEPRPVENQPTPTIAILPTEAIS